MAGLKKARRDGELDLGGHRSFLIHTLYRINGHVYIPRCERAEGGARLVVTLQIRPMALDAEREEAEGRA